MITLARRDESEEQLKVFVGVVEAYFERTTGLRATAGTPFLRRPGEAVTNDFAALIGVSGSQRGCVLFGAPRRMVLDVIRRMGETGAENDDDLLGDCVAEIANTIAGNARFTLGSHFLISVPTVYHGSPTNAVPLPSDIPAFIIPMAWNHHVATVVICLKNERDRYRNLHAPLPREATP